MSYYFNHYLARRMASAPRGGGGDGINIPTVFQRVEYIQSNGGQKIILDTEFKDTHSIEVDIQYVDATGFQYFFGPSYNNGNWFGQARGVYTIMDGAGGSVSSILRKTLRYSVESGIAYLRVDDTQTSWPFSAAAGNLTFFGNRLQNTEASSCRVFRLKVYDAGELIYDLIPCYRKSDGKPGLWDMVSWQFYTNANTSALTDFTVGPDVIQPATQYIIFVDRAVEAICVANYSSDGIGLTLQDAAAVTQIRDVFGGNTTIAHFPELQYFTGLNYQYGLRYYAFDGCSNLVDVTFPKGLYLENYTFRNCTSLTRLVVSGSGSFLKSGDEFEGCSSLTQVYANDIEQLMSLVGSNVFNYGSASFRNSSGGHIYINNVEVIDVVIPNTVTVIPFFAFQYCNSVRSVDIPASVTEIKGYSFYPCTSLKTVIIRATTPPTMASYTFWNNDADRVFYVPYSADHSVLNAYINAGVAEWTAQTVFELNPDGTIPS